MKTPLLRTISILILILAAFAGRLYAQPATYDKDKNKDPMVMKPGYVAPETDQVEATVITIGDYDNFKLGVDFAECSIANNPNNPLQFYAVWNSTAAAGGKGYYTNDGYTWTAGNPTWTGMIGDVVVSYDSLGHLAYQNMYGGASVQGVKVAMSSDNGQTWAAPLVAMSGSDKNWMFSDQTSGPYSNYIYGTMTNSSSTGQSFSRSIDQGATWTSPTSFNPGGAIPGTMVCGGPEGDIQGGAVYVVTNSGSSFSSTYTFYKSVNGGQNFSLKSTQQFANTVGTQVSGRNAVLNMRTRPYPFIACDNSYGPHRGRLYVVYASNNPSGNGNKPDIFCRYSDNGGTTWSSAKVVNDDVNSQSNHNWFPAIWCEKNTGRLYISWMDSRDCPTSDSCMIYASYTDDGLTFAPNQRISNKKMKINCNSCGGGGTPMYLGDYNGVAANTKTSLMAWTDFRDNNFGSYVAYFPDFGFRAEPAIDTLEPVATINAVIPSVKAFTDTVTVTATITGSAGLFNISYPQGNQLWSFPGQVPIEISQNTTAPIGDYTLTIVAKGSNGTPIHKRTAVIRALTPVAPTANFIVSDTSACIGKGINFTDYSAGPPTSWAWSFPGGNPSSSTVQNPVGIVYADSGSYDVTLTVTNQAGSSTVTRTNYISVYPVPEPPVAENINVCIGQAVPDLSAEGSNINWYKGAVHVGSGNTYTTGQTAVGTYNYSVTQTTNGCESEPKSISLSINPLPSVSFVMADSVCGNSPAFDLTGGYPAGGVYSGPGVGANNLTFDPSVAGAGSHELLYNYTDANACSNSATHTVTIAPLPVVSIDTVAPLCLNAPAVALTGIPAGGTFQGSGINGSLFDPAVSGAGDFTITYSYTDTITSCLVTSSREIKVNSLPVITLNDTSLCGNRQLVLNGTISNPGTYLWTPGNVNTASITIDTTGIGLGQFTYTLAVNDANQCGSSKSVKVTFFDCTGIDEPVSMNQIDLFPNPNSGQFTILVNSLTPGTYRLRIYDAFSRVVHTEENVQVGKDFRKAVNLDHLTNGVYLIRLENTSNGAGKQFIIKN